MSNKKFFKRSLALVLTFAFVILGLYVPSAKANTNGQPSAKGLNPDFVNYFKSNTNSLSNNSNRKYGFVPAPIRITNNSATNRRTILRSYPSSYDLRSLSKVTSAKNQYSVGSCWTFGTMGSLESAAIVAGKGTLDYSENNLLTHHGFALGYDDGGNYLMSTAYFSRWDGVCLETADPYPANATASSIVSRSNVAKVGHVRDVLFVADRSSSTDNDAIKAYLSTYGALGTCVYWSDSYYNSTYSSYYYSGSSQANHAVTIVGWDDNYSASNFKSRPSGNGAFIVKNSWGSSWGDGGYFYCSYYDKHIGTSNAGFINVTPVDSNESVYSYDKLGLVDQVGFSSSTGWFANAFKAASSEKLTAVGFYALQNNATYEIYAQADYDTNKLTNLTKVGSGTFETAGFHTAYLSSPVQLTSGKNFAVVVKLTSPGDTSPIAVEGKYSGYSTGATAGTITGQVSSNGTTWKNVTSMTPSDSGVTITNVCLKAYTTKSTDPVPTTEPTVAPTTAPTAVPTTAPTVAPTIAPTPVPSGDTYEPNGTVSTAYRINSGTNYNSYIYTSTDKDFYKVSVTTLGTLTINLTVPDNVDYDLYLSDGTTSWWTGSLTVLAKSVNDVGIDETITYSVRKTGTYYIYIKGYNGAYSTTLPYTLKATFK